MLWSINRALENPFATMRGLQREMNRLFDSAGGGESFPAVNIWGNDDEIIMKSELPGVDPESLDLRIVGDQLTIEGKRKQDEPGEDATYHRRERGCGSFIRTFRLPFQVDASKVEAKFLDGILKATLPRAEESKPRKIKVTCE